MANDAGILVSVIVPVRNGARDLPELIACLDRQTFPHERFEVVIGDDGSVDGGSEGLDAPDGWIRVVRGPPQNSYAARNRAARASRAPVLAFCDADCRPEPEWLERGASALEHTDIAAGRFRFIVPDRITVWALIDMDGTKDHERQVSNANAETANLFLRRELFDRMGGFDDTISEQGDFDFVERCVTAGAKLTYTPEAVVWHPVRTRARSLLRSLWIYNHGYGVRATRDGKVPEALKLRTWVPIVSPLRSRRRFGKSLAGPDKRWLAEHGVHPTLGERLASLPLLYLALPYLRVAAQLSGWWAGRRLR
ncbi:MAG: glycosyltransferase [Actinobacteria bacterium]|nr:glycosyltransferase [Actinomycetota bacterium]